MHVPLGHATHNVDRIEHRASNRWHRQEVYRHMQADPNLLGIPEKKRRLLLAALDVFAEQGFHASTIDQVAERAGVGKGTVYLYFQSKQDLFLGIIQEGLGWLVQFAARLAETEPDPKERLSKLAHWHLRVILQNYPRMRMFMTGGVPQDLHALIPEVQSRLLDYRSLYISALQAGIGTGSFRDHDCLLVATGLLGYLNQVGRYLAEETKSPDLDTTVHQVLQFIFSGIEKVGN